LKFRVETVGDWDALPGGVRVSGIGASAAASNISPQASAGDANNTAVSDDGSNLLPFDFAAMLFVATGDGGPAPDSETITTPDHEKSALSPEEPEPAGWRPGNGWLSIPGLNPIAFVNIPVELDRTFGFEQAVESGAENAKGLTTPPLETSSDALVVPVPAAGAAEQPAGPSPNPLAFQIRLTEEGIVQPPEAANQVLEAPVDAPPPTELPVRSQPSPFRELSIQAEAIPDGESEVAVEPTTAAEEVSEIGKPTAHPVTAASKHENSGEKHESSSGSGTGEGHPQRALERPPHPMPNPAPTFEVSGHTVAPRPASESRPQPVTAAFSVAPPAPPATGPVNALHIRLESVDAPQPVDVHVRERGGEIHVAVRGANPGLNQELSQDLPSLLRRLEEQGFHGEAWAGSETEKLQAVGGAEGSSDANAQNGQKDGEPSRGRDQHDRQSHPDRDPSRQRRDRNWQNEWMELTD
jgi:hypothetical protein